MPACSQWQPPPALWKRLKPLARQMRREPTIAEQMLWQHLRKRQVQGAKFRRQFAIDRFIVDFCSLETRLIIEVDGPVHQYTQAHDAIRQQFLEHLGFELLHFENAEVLADLATVLEMIEEAVVRRSTPS